MNDFTAKITVGVASAVIHIDSTLKHTHTHTRLMALFPGLPG